MNIIPNNKFFRNLLFLLLITSTQFVYGNSEAFGQVNIPTSGTNPDTLKRVQKSVQPQRYTFKKAPEPSPQSIHYIELHDERWHNNFITRYIFVKYLNSDVKRVAQESGRWLPKPLEILFNLIVEKSFRFPIIFFFILIIFFLVFNSLLVILVLIISNFTMNFRVVKFQRLRNEYEKVLTNLMLHEIDNQEAFRLLSTYGMKKNPELLIDVMMDFQKSFKGETDRQLAELYQKLNLDQYSFKKTKSSFFYHRVLGIRELTNMHPTNATGIIAKYINDYDDIVRTEAQISYPSVNKDNPFEFLSLIERPFSLWAQMNIYYYIKVHEMPVPSFARWLHSDQMNVVNFCILMITTFQQSENSAEIIELLHSDSESTRHLVIKTCNELNLIDSRAHLKKQFSVEENIQNRLEIIKAFQNIGDSEDYQFLESIIQQDDLLLKLEACRTMCNMSSDAFEYLEHLSEISNHDLDPIISHVKDTRN